MWEQVSSLADELRDRSILDLFAQDPDRFSRFSVKADDLLFDFSKTSIDDKVLTALIALTETVDFPAKRAAMFTGEKINDTEGRAVLHTALRNLDGTPVMVDGQDVMPEVLETLERMEAFATALRDGSFTGQGGAITDVVNIGIGGSDLGPVMANLALAPYCDGPRVHFVSNVDGAHVHDVLAGLNPETTLVIVASKTLTTIETMTNAETARKWMAAKVSDTGAQFAALSSNAAGAAEWGIAPDRVFGFQDWVGGRYSMWGPIGLPIMIAVGPENFRAFLSGAQAMDKHFRDAPVEQNLPVLLALVGIWHNQGLGHATRAVLPYEQRLLRLPAYLQQLEMESNGKRVSMDGRALPVDSGPIVWGEPGTNGQHAFYQLIHQGTRIVPCEFMAGIEGHEPDLAHQHDLLLANCLAQSEALLTGRSLEEATGLMQQAGFEGDELARQAAHRVFPGNRPSTTLLYPKLTPFVLGQIVALYEHRVFVEGVVLGINSFDQWGVELGKELAKKLTPILAGEQGTEGKDGSTAGLIAAIRAGT